RAAELRTLVDAALAAGAQVVIAEEGGAVSRDEASAWIGRYQRARLVRVAPPDDAVRLAIVCNAAAARSLALGSDVLAALARDPVESVRDLLGRLTRAGSSAARAPDDTSLGLRD